MRMWGKNRIDRIGRIGNGIFLVRLRNQEDHERILAMDFQFFDGKPVIVHPWKPDVDWSEKKVERVPIWIELHGLEVKYWGDKCLTKIVESIGKFVRVDEVTLEIANLMFARVLVEVLVDQMFPEVVQFRNEKGYVIEHKVYYGWKPIKCSGCKGYGHNREQCVKPKVIKKIWVKKQGLDVAPQTGIQTRTNYCWGSEGQG